MYTWHDCHILPDPYIVADDSVSFEWQLIHYRSNRTAPISSHNVEWVCRGAVHPMVGTVHNKGNSFGNCAKVTDYQPVTDKIIEMCYVFFESFSAVDVIVICVVSDDDSRILYNIFYVA